MDQNQIPSSPLQHHRPTSASSANPAKGGGDTLTLHPNLTNPDPAPRQRTTSTVDPSSCVQSWDNQTSSSTAAYPAPTTSTFETTWRGDSSPAAQWQGEASTNPSMMSNHSPSSHAPVIDIQHSSSLLTSEPLNRSSSSSMKMDIDIDLEIGVTISEPTLSPPGFHRKRERSLSLPASLGSLPKKRRPAQVPFDLSARPEKPYPNSQPGSSRAESLCSLPLTPSSSGVPATIPPLTHSRKTSASTSSLRPPVRPIQVLVASRSPPVTTSTLKSLDAREILRNPQLRHDLLFDSLAFRPIVAPSLVDSSRSDGPRNRKQAADARTSSIVADMYWESIDAEINTGCRCVRWRVLNAGDVNLDGSAMESKEREAKCVCGKWKDGLSEERWWEWQHSRWSSRIPELVNTLRELLLSLMGSTSPCPDASVHAVSSITLPGHESCGTITHALIPELCAALDPEFVTVQIRRRVFHTDIFLMVGEAMKVHCAPIRDGLIEEMVKTATDGNMTQALRKCFACAEIMKLDIANHQVHTLRPHLWKSALKDELSAFNHSLGSSHVALENSLTRRWIHEASVRVLSKITPSERRRLMDARPELVFRSLGEGFMELVFSDFSSASTCSSWPPVVQSRMQGTASVQLAEGFETGGVVLPESFKMDGRRIKNFNSDVIDLSIMHIVMQRVRATLERTRPSSNETERRASMLAIRGDIESDIMEHGGVLRVTQAADGALSSLSLQILSRIYSSGSPSDAKSTGPTIHPPKVLAQIERDAQAMDDDFAQSIRPDAPVLHAALKRVRQAMTLILANNLLRERYDPASKHYNPPEALHDVPVDELQSMAPEFLSHLSTAEVQQIGHHLQRNTSLVARTRLAYVRDQHKSAEKDLLRSLGLTDLEVEMRRLVKNMKRIVGLNLRCFVDIYGEKGMVVG